MAVKGTDWVSLISAIALNAVSAMFPDGGHVSQDGVVLPGSWNPAEGTVDVLVLETASTIPEPTEQPLVRYSVQYLTTAHGHQCPPVGGERVLLIPRHSGWACLLEHGEDDSPNAPAGEAWFTHSTGSYIKMLNSGNVTRKANSALIDSGHTYSLTTTSGATITGSVVVTSSGGGTPYALVRVSDLNAVITAFNSHTHSGVQGGSGNTGTPTSSLGSATGSSVISAI